MNGKGEGSREEKEFSILIVEGDFEISDQIERILKNDKRFDFEFTTVNKYSTALDHLEAEGFDLVMSDYEFEELDGKEMDGIEFLRKVKNDHGSDTVRLLILEDDDISLAEKSLREGDINGYITNPSNSQEVKLVVFEKLVRTRELERKRRMDVDKVSEAIQFLEQFQTDIKRGTSTEKETLIFEFGSSSEFNKFSYKLRRMKNVQILDVNIFEDKYVINVGLYPESYEKIR